MAKPLPKEFEALRQEADRYVADFLHRISNPAPAESQEEAKSETKPEPAKEVKKEEAKPVNESGALEFVVPAAAKVVEKKINIHDYFAKLPADVMAELKRKIPVFTSKVQQELAGNFVKVLTPPTKLVGKTAEEKKESLEGLSLVNDDDLVLRLVTDQVSKQLNEKYIISIALLGLRFEKILGFEIDLFLNPLGPISIGSAMENAMQQLEINNLQKKYLLTAIEKAMAVEYRNLLQTLNNLLIQKGVLPKLTDKDGKERSEKYLQKLKADKEAAEKDKDGKGDGDKDGKGDGDGSALLKSVVIPEGSQHRMVSNPNGPMIQQSQMFQNFDSVNTMLVQPDAQTGYMQPVQNQGSLTEMLATNTDISQYGMSPASEKTIGIMSMIFETLSSDKNLSGPIKGLLLQLVIPLLKAAIEDEDFFEDSANPAQVLFNTISEAGMSWSQEKNVKNDFLYQKMSAVVQKVTSEYDSDKAVFEEAVSDLGTFVDSEKERSSKMEERMVSTATAQARLAAAKNIAESHISDIFADEELPEKLKKFIDERWQPVLFYIYNKYEDVNCGAWHEAVHLEWKIINSLHGDDDVSIEDIMVELTQKLEIIGLNPDEYKEELDSIRPFLRGTVDPLKPRAQHESPEKAAQVLEEAKAVLAEMDAKAEAANTPKAAANDDNVTSIKTLDSPEEIKEKFKQLDLQEILKHLSIGCWVEDLRVDPLVKMKLAAYIKYTDTYILVNRKGAKCGSFKSMEFAEKFRDNQFRMVDSTISFDRALESIIGRLRPENEAA